MLPIAGVLLMIACINCISYFGIKGVYKRPVKYHTFEINGQPVNLFEHDKNGNLIPMPHTTINMEAVVSEIVRQLGNWNVQTGQGGVVTSSQGGFNFHVRGRRTIRAPDVSFTSKNVYRHLTQQQLWTFKGEPFTPTVVIEVSDTIKDSDTKKKNKVFDDLDEKFKSEYLAVGTSVQIDGGDTLPGFTLDVKMIKDIISQKSRPTEASKKPESRFSCPKCDNHFTDNYSFIKHFERSHICD
ncbi:17545_t:CDS:2 [Dentiscutata erythropus]|uniref:17545_t:CDS:1 n=1 Tax=Dentiscutata erythropus TaxID=1348616 RepID=A0A9N9B2A6_9GLOM|nr:17545_t:CDS:2 [Dentiscutata erythropus]